LHQQNSAFSNNKQSNILNAYNNKQKGKNERYNELGKIYNNPNNFDYQ